MFASNGTHEKKAKNVSSEQIRLLKTKIEQTARTFVKPTTGQGIGATAKQSTAGDVGDEEDGAQAELRKARFFAQQKITPKNDRKRVCSGTVYDVRKTMCED